MCGIYGGQPAAVPIRGYRMSKLSLSIAVRDYDRTRPLTDGTVQIDGVDPVFMALEPEEIFFRAFRHAEFDICELSLSSSTVKTAQGDFAYVGVPAFVSRAFRHTSIYVRTDRVKQPADLKGRKVGVAEYQLTANVWARAHAGGRIRREAVGHPLDQGRTGAGRAGVEKIAIKLPADVRLDPAPEGRRSTPCWRRARSMRSSARARRPVSSAARRISAGSGRIRWRPRRSISARPATSRSCT